MIARYVNGLSVLASLALATSVLAMPTVKKADDPVPKEVAAAISELLAPECYKVAGDGEDSLRFWVRKVVPTKATESPVRYSALEEGTLLGVLEIKGSTWSDFRAQELPAGLFVVRLIFQPQDGDHMGVAPFPEFIALTPVASDKDPKTLTHEEVVELSKETLETGHPAVMFLNPYFDKPDFEFPAVNTNAFGHVVLNVTTQASPPKAEKTIDLPIGLIIVGHSPDAG